MVNSKGEGFSSASAAYWGSTDSEGLPELTLALCSVLPPERILCTWEGHDDEINIEIQSEQHPAM